jgi:hypothetical protein
MRPSLRFPRVRATLALLAVATLLAAAPPEDPSETGEEPEGGEVAPPQVTSPWRSYHFDAPTEQVRSLLDEFLKSEGLVLQPGKSEDGTLRTELKDFDEKKFQRDVSVPPPRASTDYPFYQTNAMTSGRYGLEFRLDSEGESRTRILLRAHLEIRAMNRRARKMIWVPRISNGEVERQFVNHLTLRLLAATRPAASGPR